MNDEFNELESEISGDWGEIQSKINHKNYLDEERKRVNRLDCPSYDHFFDILFRMYSEGIDLSRSKVLHEILQRMFSYKKELMPKSFGRIWRAFCSPYEYRFKMVECFQCKDKFDIFYKPKEREFSFNFRFDMNGEYQIKVTEVFCPACGLLLAKIADGSVVSVTKHEKKYP